MRDDYEEQKYDLLRREEGPWPEKDNLSVERLSSEAFGIGIGDKVIFELDKTDRALPITGKIQSAFVHPPQFGGPAVFYTDAQGLEPSVSRPGSLTACRCGFDAEFARDAD
jgi:hypothetical protein